MNRQRALDILQRKLNGVPHLSLGLFPTPVRRIDGPGGEYFWLKDDGVCSETYGGNKVRKLEYLLADASERGIKKLVVYGDAGSHNVAAISVFGRRIGFEVDAIVFPYDEGSDLEDCCRRLEKLEVNVFKRNTMSASWFSAFLKSRPRANMLVPLGSSMPLTSLGYVRAAMELWEQIDDGSMAAPEKIYIAFGTGSSVAGLLVGLSLLDFPAQVVAVRTVDSIIASEEKLKILVKGALQLLDLPLTRFEQAWSCLDRIEHRHLGEGYRDITPEAKRAIEFMKPRHCRLESVFTGKAMAGLLDDLPRFPDGQVLFWNTHDQNG